MNKSISFLTVALFLLFLIDVPLISQVADGKTFLAEGKKLFSEGKFDEATRAFDRAITHSLAVNEMIEAHLYSGACWTALNSKENAKKHFINILRIDPEYIFEVGDFPDEISRRFTDAKKQFPIIYDLTISPIEFHPYANEKPAIMFKLTAADCINMNLDDGSRPILQLKKCFETTGVQQYTWEWDEKLSNLSLLNLNLIPEKNSEEYKYTKKLTFQTTYPSELVYTNSEFILKGYEFLPETKIKRTYENAWFYTLLAGGLGYYSYMNFSKDPRLKTNEGTMLAAGIGSAVLGVACVILALSPKKQQVPDRNSIEKNREAREKIKALKESIVVRQEMVIEKQ